MYGLQVNVSELVSGRSVIGSANTCSVAIVEKKNVSTSDGRISGILIRSAIWVSVQPSSRADSYSSGGTARSAV